MASAVAGEDGSFSTRTVYGIHARLRRDWQVLDGLGDLAERAVEQDYAAVAPLRPAYEKPGHRMRLEDSISSLPALPDFLSGAALAAGAIGIASLSDKPVDRIASKHRGSSIAHRMDKLGGAVPAALVGAAALAAAFGDDRMHNTGLIALQSMGLTLGASIGVKHIVARARPEEERGRLARTADRSNASFPSNHASVAFAGVTPFAKEYDAPWLYGVAAVAAMGRVAGRKHWMSDVVGGGLLGYATGTWLWNAQRRHGSLIVSFDRGANAIGLTWQKDY